ncbi:hypothetical protein GCM10007103_12260 [Salinimicrobium marinum]|uniref:Mechanosensitive ion channel n=1 Tax=Salinimicrobium marinum TaxID=680283 RepID=A0A918VXB9_9FLAO|nr:mechanosensitive ion channel family protein [Salinimicrobium marinum]GHA32159.1 hypothetical protein GCM10007103_12260 [Salinimicrobium marinum]
MLQDDNPVDTRNLTESFVRFYNSLIEQLPGIVMGILLITVGVLLGTYIGRFATKRISSRTDDPLMSRFLGKTIRFIFIVIAVMLGLRAAGLGGIATGILTAAGASALVLGFAFKDIGENFIAGIILAFNRPFDVNDTVEIGPNFGKVKGLEFRYTKLKTFDGKDVYIPNSDVLTDPVTNYTEDGFFRWNFSVGIAYENDIQGAKNIILEVLKNDTNVIEDEEHINFVIEDELATSTVNLKVFFWVDTTDFRRFAMVTRGKVIREVKEALEANGYYLPADIQEIKLYGTEKDFPVRLSKPLKKEGKN